MSAAEWACSCRWRRNIYLRDPVVGWTWDEWEAYHDIGIRRDGHTDACAKGAAKAQRAHHEAATIRCQGCVCGAPLAGGMHVEDTDIPDTVYTYPCTTLPVSP